MKRKSHNLDEGLLLRARKVLGARTETAAIHEALRNVVEADAVLSDLEKARDTRRGGRALFRDEFARRMRAERTLR